MKIIIDHQGMKREIDGPFALCIGRVDAERLVYVLEEALKSLEGFGYGWIDVPVSTPVQTHQKPRGWTE